MYIVKDLIVIGTIHVTQSHHLIFNLFTKGKVANIFAVVSLWLCLSCNDVVRNCVITTSNVCAGKISDRIGYWHRFRV